MSEEQLQPRLPGPAVSRAIRGGSVFVGLSLVQRVLPFLLLPAFAAALSPGEYGQIAFLVAVAGILGAAFSLGLESHVIRTYVQLADQPGACERFVNSMGLFAGIAPLIGAVAAAAAFAMVAPLRDSAPDMSVVILALLGTALGTTATTFTGALLRAQDRIRGYALAALLQGVGSPLLAAFLVVVLDLGIVGWFAATFIGSAASLLVGLMLLRHRWTRSIDRALIGAALAFGIPLLPHALSHWALNLSDRIVLTGYVPQGEVGIYNLAYQLAAPIGLILVAMRQGLMPMYSAASRDPELRVDLRHVSTAQAHIAGLLGLSVALLGPSLIWLAFPSAYQPSAALVPWIALGYVLFGLYLIPVDSLTLMLGRTRWIWVPTGVAALSNITLNLLLVPRFGALAAAVNTAVAYGILAMGIVAVRRAQSGPRIDYDIAKMSVGLAIVAAAWLAALAVVPAFDSTESLIVRVVIVVGAAVVIWAYDRSWWHGLRKSAGTTSSSDEGGQAPEPMLVDTSRA